MRLLRGDKMIYGIKLKIKAQRERLKLEEAKNMKEQDPEKIKILKRSIRCKKAQVRKLKQKNVKGRR